MPVSEVFNEDCMLGMVRYPNKFFDLAIVDPPYGIGIAEWDNSAPPKEYFNELFRVSKNQIVWGANHFWSHSLPNTDSFIFWDKKQQGKQARGEMAWCSLGKVEYYLREWQWDRSNVAERIHVCQKPTHLYRWILKKYAKQGDKILDTHMGSQSSRIAAYDYEFDYWGFEIDKEYFETGCKRFNNHIAQLKLFRA